MNNLLGVRILSYSEKLFDIFITPHCVLDNFKSLYGQNGPKVTHDKMTDNCLTCCLHDTPLSSCPGVNRGLFGAWSHASAAVSVDSSSLILPGTLRDLFV